VNKEWFILIEGKKYGPFSKTELREHPRFTPDTLVWKMGFSKWISAGKIKELKEVFEDEERDKQKENEKEEEEQALRLKGTESILSARLNPGFFLWWIIWLMIILLYSVYKLYLSK
jgi:hypothetical protein